ncbi:MAG: hypothetical protein IIB04_03220 [Acidobacteria bacterium]|nr:hypothetical protein [Acidobacteriota bacterium]MCH8985606.1 hypothetical protein [Acidobacteriota bacterium]
MRYKIKMPKVADSVDEVVILEWLTEVGSIIEAGQPLVQVETDKVDMEVPSPVSGTLIEMLVSSDDEVSTGTPICIIEA